ncbi:MAG: GtrA family protein [Chloroflexota bacterium]|nr:GtrA family protein [Chloroflexota bacterium]
MFSISAGTIEIDSFSVLTELTQWSYWPCYLIALILFVIWNFTLNRRFTFRSSSNIPAAMLKVYGYYLVFTPGSTIFGSYLAETLLWNKYLVTGINMVINFVTEYLFQRFVVFSSSLDTNSLSQDDMAGQDKLASED